MDIQRLTTPWWALRIALGAAAFLAGLDKFFNLLADWPGYLSPLAAQVLPFSPAAFMHVVGVIEMIVGGVVLAGYTRIGGYVAAGWLAGIALNLLTTGRYFDVAVRDVVLAIAAFTLARLTEAGIGGGRPSGHTRRARQPGQAHRVSASRDRLPLDCPVVIERNDRQRAAVRAAILKMALA